MCATGILPSWCWRSKIRTSIGNLLPGQLDEKVAKLYLHALGAALCASRVPVFGILNMHVDALWEEKLMNVSNTMDFRDGVSHTALIYDCHALPHGILNVHVDASQARTPEKLMNVSRVKVGISCVASGLVFQTVNQALCVHRNDVDTSRTSFEILKLSNRVERELMDVVPSSHSSLLLVFTTTEGPARPLPSITMHAASACPKVSNYAVNFTGVGVCAPRPAGHSEFCNYDLAYGMRRTGC